MRTLIIKLNIYYIITCIIMLIDKHCILWDSEY